LKAETVCDDASLSRENATAESKELRAARAVSMARLWSDQGKRDAAAIYSLR
jgi:hypothetical protein